MDIELITIIIGFVAILLAILGAIIVILQGNNNLRIEFKQEFNKLDSKIDDLKKENKENFNILSTRIDKLSDRIDAVNNRLDSLYRELFKRDAA